MKGIREIAITDMPEVSIGNVQNDEAKTGVTLQCLLKCLSPYCRSGYQWWRTGIQGNSADFSGYSG